MTEKKTYEVPGLAAYDPGTAYGSSRKEMKYLEYGGGMVAYRWVTTTNKQLRSGRHPKMNIRTAVVVFGTTVGEPYALGKEMAVKVTPLDAADKPEVERLLREKETKTAPIDFFRWDFPG